MVDPAARLQRLGELVVGAAAVALYALVTPLGAAGSPGQRSPTPLAGLAAAAAGALPLGDAALRAHVIGALVGALVLIVLVRHASEAGDKGVSSAVASLAGAAVVGVTVGYLLLATRSAGETASVALTAGSLLLAARVSRDAGAARAGLGLAILAGLCVGAHPAAAALVWPPAAVLTLRALRRGERWPLCAPLLFAAGAGIAVGSVVSPGAAPGSFADLLGVVTLASLREALAAWSRSGAPGVVTLGLELGRELGVVASLLALAGLGVLLARREAAAGLALWTLLGGLLVAAASHAGGLDGRPAFVAAAAAMALPVATGIAALSSAMGRARVAASAALGVIAIAEPAFRSLAPFV